MAHLNPSWVPHNVTREIVTLRFAASGSGSWNGVAAFLESCPKPEQRQLITQVVATEKDLPQPAQQLADVVLKLRNNYLEKQMAELMLKLNQPETAEEERLDLIRRREELRLSKRQPLATAV